MQERLPEPRAGGPQRLVGLAGIAVVLQGVGAESAAAVLALVELLLPRGVRVFVERVGVDAGQLDEKGGSQPVRQSASEGATLLSNL